MEPGLQIRDFRLVRRLGAGGMGEVWEAHEGGVLKRRVAIKCLPEDYVSQAHLKKRFLHEVQTLAKLEHPGIVPAYDGFEENGRVYLVMKLIDGWTLEEVIRQSGVPSPEVLVKWLRQLLSALVYVHGQSILHRDIKPSNVIITQSLDARLIDFGIAFSDHGQTRLTSVGRGVGTPQFMSPEQSRGEDLDARTDLYSLALTIVSVWTGSVPSGGSSDVEALLPATAPKNLRKALVKCAEINKRDRYSSATEVLEVLGKQDANFKLLAVGAGCTAAIGLAALIFFSQRGAPVPPDMVRIPAGEFLSGMDAHQVPDSVRKIKGWEVAAQGTVTKHLEEFDIDKYEVTNQEYARFVRETKWRAPPHWNRAEPSPEIAKHPVVNVSWQDASAFASWKKKRLPTSDEWEKAARGTRGNTYPWGDTFCEGCANTGAVRQGTSKITEFPRDISPYGVLGMGGNVSEWTASPHAGSEDSPLRYYLRGGSWPEIGPASALSTYSRHSRATERYSRVGFRCAR